jgi:hypothetical protein
LQLDFGELSRVAAKQGGSFAQLNCALHASWGFNRTSESKLGSLPYGGRFPAAWLQGIHQLMTAIGNKKDTFLHIRHDIWVSIFIFISIIAVYWQVRNHDFVNFDDDRYVTDNYRIKSGLTAENITWAFTAFHVSNWHPLTWLSHMVDYQLFGLNPGKHHIFSVMLHIANSLLLLYLLRRMTGSLWRSSIVAALFALHPVHVESVAWISERKDVLSTFFWMLCLFSYIGSSKRDFAKNH